MQPRGSQVTNPIGLPFQHSSLQVPTKVALLCLNNNNGEFRWF